MNTTRPCGCKSFRSCYVCERDFGIKAKESAMERVSAYAGRVYDYDFATGQAVLGERRVALPGLRLLQDFVSEREEADLVRDLDALPWDASQSGRRKQNFGPRANFKKRKAKVGADFRGFPRCTEFVQRRFDRVPCLAGYRTVEQCSIEYTPETGACIDPHIDDCWIWGERIVQLNLLSNSVLMLLPYHGDLARYNLPDVATYPRVLDDAGNKVLFNPFGGEAGQEPEPEPYRLRRRADLLDGAVRVPLPRRSLLVMHGEPRYDWEHCILREDIHARRVVIAYRELTPPYLPGGKDEQVGRDILRAAEQFWE